MPVAAHLPPAVRRGQGVPDGMALACHIGHISPKLHVQIWSRGVKVKRPGIQPAQLNGERRGQVNGLSSKARARLLWCAENTPALNCKGLMFVTLTYPGEWPKDGREVKRHLDTFGKRMRRVDGFFLWVLEYQTRGAPHFHLLAKFPGDWDLKQVREWVEVAWFQVVGSGDEKHLNAGTSVEIVKNPAAAGYYVSQYAGKWDQKTIPAGVTLPGRMWGLVGCKIPKPKILNYGEDERDGIQLIRLIKRAAASEYAFHQRRKILLREERQARIDAIARKGEQAIRENAEYIHHLFFQIPVVDIPVFARHSWHPRDPGRGVGFSVRNVAEVVRQYLARTSSEIEADGQGRTDSMKSRGFGRSNVHAIMHFYGFPIAKCHRGLADKHQ